MKKFNLSDIPRLDPFSVPEGYLQNLPEQIQEQVIRQTHVHLMDNFNARDTRFAFFLPKFQLAFSVFTLLVVSVLVWQQPQMLEENNANVLLKETSPQDIAAYLSTYSSLSQQELSSNIAHWEDYSSNNFHEIPSAEAFETEILHDLDIYTAEELWK